MKFIGGTLIPTLGDRQCFYFILPLTLCLNPVYPLSLGLLEVAQTFFEGGKIFFAELVRRINFIAVSFRLPANAHSFSLLTGNVQNRYFPVLVIYASRPNGSTILQPR